MGRVACAITIKKVHRPSWEKLAGKNKSGKYQYSFTQAVKELGATSVDFVTKARAYEDTHTSKQWITLLKRCEIHVSKSGDRDCNHKGKTNFVRTVMGMTGKKRKSPMKGARETSVTTNPKGSKKRSKPTKETGPSTMVTNNQQLLDMHKSLMEYRRVDNMELMLTWTVDLVRVYPDLGQVCAAMFLDLHTKWKKTDFGSYTKIYEAIQLASDISTKPGVHLIEYSVRELSNWTG